MVDSLQRFRGAAKILDSDAFVQAAEAHNLETALLLALAAQETGRLGAFQKGMPVILFERHIFRRLTKKRFDSFPDFSGDPGKYARDQAGNYDRLTMAMALDRDAALQSCSWGRFQIMGFNYKLCGYASIDAFVDAMCADEANHLQAMLRFLVATKALDKLRRKDWHGFARIYNGPAYHKHFYHTKLEAHYLRFAGEAATAPPPKPATQSRTVQGLAGAGSLVAISKAAEEVEAVRAAVVPVAEAAQSLTGLPWLTPPLVFGVAIVGVLGWLAWRHVRKMKRGMLA